MRVRDLLDAHHGLGRIDGAAALAAGGELVETWARGEARPGVPVSPDTRFPIGSITKSIVAAAVLQLAARGRLELHAPIGRYLPAGLVAWGDRVTPHHCLAHTAGIPSLLRSHHGVPAVPLERLAAPIARDELVGLFGNLPLRFEPGTRFEYSNSGYVLLALAIEHVAGRPLHEHLARDVLAPAGVAMGVLDPRELEVVPMIDGAPAPMIHGSWLLGAGDLVASAADLARWLARIEAVLPGPWLARQLERHTPRHGYGVRLGVRRGREVAWHEGMLPGAVATAHRSGDAVAVVVTARHAGGGHARTFLNRVADQLVAIGCGETPPDPPRAHRAFTARELAELPGTYHVDAERTLTIERAGDALRARAEGPWLLQGGPPEEDTDEDVARTAARFVEALRAARWDDAHALCSSAARHAATPQTIAATWSALTGRLGPIAEARETLVCGGVAWLRARFAGGAELDLRVTTDEDGLSVAAIDALPPGLGAAATALPLCAAAGGRLHADGFAAGVPDAWVDLDVIERRAIVGRKHC